MSSPLVPPGPQGSPQVSDPDRVDAVESLYRGSVGRSGLRSWEPSLRPPEGTLDHSWLYRPEAPAPAEAVPAAPQPEPAPSADPAPEPGASASTSAPSVAWGTPTLRPARRWPVLVLLTGALAGAALLSWVATGTPVL